MSSAGSFICVNDFEEHAKEMLPRDTIDYYSAGACSEETLRNNEDSFKR